MSSHPSSARRPAPGTRHEQHTRWLYMLDYRPHQRPREYNENYSLRCLPGFTLLATGSSLSQNQDRGKPGDVMTASALANSTGVQFELTEEQHAILDQADRFGRKELYGLSERMDRDEWWPEDAFSKIGDAGYFGITIPEQYGGTGLDLVSAGLVTQAFSRWN